MVPPSLQPRLGREPTKESSIQYEDPGDGNTLRDALANKGIQIDPTAQGQIENIRETVSLVRALKAQFNLATNNNVALYYEADEDCCQIIESYKDKLLRIIGAKSLEPKQDDATTPATVTPLGTPPRSWLRHRQGSRNYPPHQRTS